MASVGVSSMKLIDSDGDPLDDGDGRLKVLLEAADLNIGNVDVLSIVPGTAATNLGKAEDEGHTSGDVGVMALAVRQDAVNSLSDAGDYTPLQVTSGGELRVNFASKVGGTEALNTAGVARSSSQRGNVPLVVRNDELAISSAGHIDGDYTFFQVNSIGGLYVTGSEVENAAVQSQPLLIGGRYDSSARTLDSGDAGAVALTAKGEVIVAIPSASHGWIAREDGAHTSAEYGVPAMTVRNDVLAALTSDDGDYATLQVDAEGALYTTHGMTGMVHGINSDVDATAEQLDGSTSGLDTACKRVDLMGHPDNTGDIYVGSTNAIAGDGSVGGIRLQPGDFYSIDVNNLNDIWIEASIANQKLNYIYYT